MPPGPFIRAEVIKALAIPGIGAYNVGQVLDLTEAQFAIFEARGFVRAKAPPTPTHLPMNQKRKLQKAAAEGRLETAGDPPDHMMALV